MEILLAAGAKKKVKDNGGNTALTQASYFGRTDAVKALLAYGAKRETRALDCATKNGHSDIVALLSSPPKQKQRPPPSSAS